MRDFTSSRNAGSEQKKAKIVAQPTQGFAFSGMDDDGPDDPVTAALKASIARNLAPHGVTGIVFAEDDDLIAARVRIKGHEAGYAHISDGTPTGCLCGWTTPAPAMTSAPWCPVCERLDA